MYRYLHEVVLGGAGPQQWVFDEMKAVREMGFRWARKFLVG